MSSPISAPIADYRGRLFLTVSDVASIVGADPRTVRRGIDDGTIPAVKIGHTIRVPAATFWPQVCGLDPITLRPLGIPGGDQAGPDESEAEPASSATATTSAPSHQEPLDGRAPAVAPASNVHPIRGM